MYDAIVIGARCGGAPTAMLLARKGYKVLLADRSSFPSEIPHGHFIHRQGPRLLRQWGLLDRVAASNCPAVVECTMDLGDFPLTGHNLEVDGVPLGYGPRRKVLDQVLIDAACEAGAEFRQNFAVEEYVADGDRIAGIRSRSTRDGSHQIEHGRITVGAEGRNSLLARTVNAKAYEEVGVLACWYFSYWSNAPVRGLEVYARERLVILAFPTNDNLTAVFIGWPIQEFGKIKADIERSFEQALSTAPDLEQRIMGGKRVERFYGTADLPNFLRKPFGNGWALVGDAGCHKDPYLALGICDAFRDAALLTSAIDEGLSGKRPMEEALADFEQQRNEAVLAAYRENIERARFGPVPPNVLALRRAIQGNGPETTQFFLARLGQIPAEQFFNPENIERLLSANQSRMTKAVD